VSGHGRGMSLEQPVVTHLPLSNECCYSAEVIAAVPANLGHNHGVTP